MGSLRHTFLYSPDSSSYSVCSVMDNPTQDHSTALEDQTPLAGPTDDRPDANPKPASDTPCIPCEHKMNGRNLIVCIDGTSNQFGEKNTNVIELYHLILKAEDNQRTWYNSGIGTYAQPSWKSLSFYKKVIYHKIDLAIAWNFERTVIGAYHWLSDNYEKDDCIFLFGFSRGAFQVRVLSAMIEKVGLVYRGNEMQIPFAYELYADPKSGRRRNNQEPLTKADHFKKTFSNENVRVHFVGAWDTVSSIGIARGKHMLPGTIDGMTHVCYFRHALALDERRVKFLPEYAYGGSAKPVKLIEKILAVNEESPSTLLSTEEEEAVNEPTGFKRTLPQTKEVWFAGTHSDIGGGNVENTAMKRSRPPLRWMVFEAAAAGLRTARFERELLDHEQINIIESLTWPWLLFEVCPLKRLTFTRKEDGRPRTTPKPHLGAARKIHRGQKIHSSLLRADGPTAKMYTPKARPVNDDGSFWEMLHRKGICTDVSEWLELDLYEHSGHAVEQLVNENDDSALTSLEHIIAVSGDARQAVYSKVVETLISKEELTPMIKYRLLDTTMQVLTKSFLASRDLRLGLTSQIQPVLLDLLRCGDTSYQNKARDFIALFTDSCKVFHLGERVWAVAISPDGKRLVSGLDGQTVRMWDAETGKPVGTPLRGHSHTVVSVTFSPDGTRILSGSACHTVLIWDVETGKLVGEPLSGHTQTSDWSVAFSPDGMRMASTSKDKKVRIRDVETGQPAGLPLQEHNSRVRSVAFSPDGTRIAFGSDDDIVRIWYAESGKTVGYPYREQSKGSVICVAFSPDGARIVSGSGNNTVRIWDPETGMPVGKPLEGHSDYVRSVAFSPDSKRIVSGSDDKTLRIWDAEKGEPVGEAFWGHRHWVTSVAFSPDGTRVISGSRDETIRIWDWKALAILGTAGTSPTVT